MRAIDPKSGPDSNPASGRKVRSDARDDDSAAEPDPAEVDRATLPDVFADEEPAPSSFEPVPSRPHYLREKR